MSVWWRSKLKNEIFIGSFNNDLAWYGINLYKHILDSHYNFSTFFDFNNLNGKDFNNPKFIIKLNKKLKFYIVNYDTQQYNNIYYIVEIIK